MVLAFVFALVLIFFGSVLSFYPGLVVRNALVNRRTNMNLATRLALTSFHQEEKKWEMGNIQHNLSSRKPSPRTKADTDTP